MSAELIALLVFLVGMAVCLTVFTVSQIIASQERKESGKREHEAWRTVHKVQELQSNLCHWLSQIVDSLQDVDAKRDERLREMVDNMKIEIVHLIESLMGDPQGDSKQPAEKGRTS